MHLAVGSVFGALLRVGVWAGLAGDFFFYVLRT